MTNRGITYLVKILLLENFSMLAVMVFTKASNSLHL